MTEPTTNEAPVKFPGASRFATMCSKLAVNMRSSRGNGRREEFESVITTHVNVLRRVIWRGNLAFFGRLGSIALSPALNPPLYPNPESSPPWISLPWVAA